MMEIRPDKGDPNDITMLYNASRKGSVVILNELIQKDPLILSKISLTFFTETPLHISALLGHSDFTEQLLAREPSLAAELDSLRRSPLHLASAKGHAGVVRVLLEKDVEGRMCLVKDQDGMIPLHYAAMRGRSDVIKLLIGAQHGSIFETLPSGETALHLCVQHNHLEALKLLSESVGHDNMDFFNLKERIGGNTVLHFAVMLKQIETVEYLLSLSGVKSGAQDIVNHRGLKALDLFELFPRDFQSLTIRRCFTDAFELDRSKSQQPDPPPAAPPAIPQAGSDVARNISTKKKKRRSWLGKFIRSLKYNGAWVEDKRGSIMIVATVISTMAFQAATNPPGGVWQQNTNTTINGFDCGEHSPCLAGTSVFARSKESFYDIFVACNSASFLASGSVILLLISGVPLRNKLFMFLLTVAMCAALTFLALSFFFGVQFVTPDTNYQPSTYLAGPVWLLLLGFIALVHTVRFLVWTVKKLRRIFGPKSSGNAMNRTEVLDP